MAITLSLALLKFTTIYSFHRNSCDAKRADGDGDGDGEEWQKREREKKKTCSKLQPREFTIEMRF